MKVTQVAIRPTEVSLKTGRPSLTPELLASVGARYSRNNEGLEAILAKIDFGNEEDTYSKIKEIALAFSEAEEGWDRMAFAQDQMLTISNLVQNIRPPQLDKGVDAIFNMIDYGHESIADMTPVAMFMDGISIYAAYYIWSITAVAGGQESSTRYIKMSVDGLLDPEVLGIPEDQQEGWKLAMAEAFDKYQQNSAFWEQLSLDNPSLMRIPTSLLESQDEKDQKKVERMRRNYVFDRARVFLPVGAATNVMMIQSARAWAHMISTLLSNPMKELQTLGEMLKAELALAAPRLIKHATYRESTAAVLNDEFWLAREMGQSAASMPKEDDSLTSIDPQANLEVFAPSFLSSTFARSLKHRVNRYSVCGSDIARTCVRFSWPSVALAEIRDLNRHRTGTKFCPQYPVGFYAAEDQIPEGMTQAKDAIKEYAQFGNQLVKKSVQQYLSDDFAYIYWCLLGTQFPFEHTTTADKFIYEAELRTGLGAHYRYAKHLHDALEVLYKKEPQLKGLIKEGTAEPE